MIEDARRHIYEAAVRTPLVRLNWEQAPAEIYLKLENLQPIGSFKIRGAYNAVRLLPPEQRKLGVWTVSAGNAAQGVGFAAQKAGVPWSVLVMDTAPATKLDAIRRLQGKIVKASFDECWEALEARQHPQMQGTFVHPFEDDEFIAGNATMGLEILDDLPDVIGDARERRGEPLPVTSFPARYHDASGLGEISHLILQIREVTRRGFRRPLPSDFSGPPVASALERADGPARSKVSMGSELMLEDEPKKREDGTTPPSCP